MFVYYLLLQIEVYKICALIIIIIIIAELYTYGCRIVGGVWGGQGRREGGLIAVPCGNLPKSIL